MYCITEEAYCNILGPWRNVSRDPGDEDGRTHRVGRYNQVSEMERSIARAWVVITAGRLLNTSNE